MNTMFPIAHGQVGPLVSTSSNKERTGNWTTVREIIFQWMELELDEAVRITCDEDQT